MAQGPRKRLHIHAILERDLLAEEHQKHPSNLYMFPSPKTGTMYDPDAFRHIHDKILKAIGAEHVRFHDMRHLFATLSLKNGVDVKTLSGALGHSVRTEFCVFGWLTTSSPLMRLTCLVIEIVLASISRSVHRSASSSPRRKPVVSSRLDVSKAGNYTVTIWIKTWYEVYAEPRLRPKTKDYYLN